VKCSFIIAKSRTAPLQYVSVPRLGLQAASIAVRVHGMILKEIDLNISSTFFWTDSKITQIQDLCCKPWISRQERRCHWCNPYRNLVCCRNWETLPRLRDIVNIMDIDIDSLLKLVRYTHAYFLFNASLSCTWGGVLLGALCLFFPPFGVMWPLLSCYRACYGVVVLVYAVVSAFHSK